MELQEREIRPSLPPCHSRIMKRDVEQKKRSGEQKTPRN